MMHTLVSLLIVVSCRAPAVPVQVDETSRLMAGDHERTIESGHRQRHYLVHVPRGYDPKRPVPVVLALHGAAMTGELMARMTGLNDTADREGFVVVYPDGTGSVMTWNSGGFSGRLAENRPDDVAFVADLLDDLAGRISVDQKRIYACGMSNGGMMCYRLAAELSDRIAAIAPVAGTVAIEKSEPKRPVPVLHIHGRKDRIVPFEGSGGRFPAIMKFKGVEESVTTWAKLDGCDPEPKTNEISMPGANSKITRKTFVDAAGQARVELIELKNGGHVWPGRGSKLKITGEAPEGITANDLIWNFFRRFEMN
jgi:polyhydroxybutyrate depolymerase